MHLSCLGEAPVKRDQLWIPVKGCRQCSGVKRATQPLPTAPDVTDTDQIAALVIVGSKAGKRRGLLTRDAADLWHAHQDADCGLHSDAIDAVDQIKPLGQIAMLANIRNKALKLGFFELFEARNLCLPDPVDARIAAGIRNGS